MKIGKMFLCGLFVLLMICTIPVGAHRAINDDATVINSMVLSGVLNSFNILQNDIPYPDPSVISIEITQNPIHGSVYQDSNFGIGTYDYLSNDPAYFGTDYFKYRTFDGHTYSNEATVYLNIIPYPDISGTPSSVRFNTSIDTELSVDNPSYSNYLLNPNIPNDRWIDLVSNPNHGQFTLEHCGGTIYQDYRCFDYMPNAGFKGWDTFSVLPWMDTFDYGFVSGRPIHITIYVGPEPYPAPEFPSPILPAAMVIGFLGTVLFIRRTGKH
jgi:hypothetical protein